jgi:hypothetical protein
MQSNEKRVTKTEKHIIELAEVDADLCLALGKMVIAFGRLEYMFKIAIKRLENGSSLENVIAKFDGQKGTLKTLSDYCQRFPELSTSRSTADGLNQKRNDFIHATIGKDLKHNGYVRFRKLVGYRDLENDIIEVNRITQDVNSLIVEIDEKTGAPLKSFGQHGGTFAVTSGVSRGNNATLVINCSGKSKK